MPEHNKWKCVESRTRLKNKALNTCKLLLLVMKVVFFAVAVRKNTGSPTRKDKGLFDLTAGAAHNPSTRHPMGLVVWVLALIPPFLSCFQPFSSYSWPCKKYLCRALIPESWSHFIDYPR
ncbi:hypothetical protein J6590_064403 [Homalodisca vitripennis]|nr:hypothetical protein J6590_064403 [Homalodisca vitripennis]